MPVNGVRAIAFVSEGLVATVSRRCQILAAINNDNVVTYRLRDIGVCCATVGLATSGAQTKADSKEDGFHIATTVKPPLPSSRVTIWNSIIPAALRVFATLSKTILSLFVDAVNCSPSFIARMRLAASTCDMAFLGTVDTLNDYRPIVKRFP